MDFMDLLLAEALAAGMARQAAEARQRPPPDNFFILPPDPQAWRKLHAACKEEHMVICIEITDDSHPPSRRAQPLFVELAREVSQIPFFRVKIGFGRTYDQLREDVGGVRFTPTILVILFDDSVRIARVEGEDEIRIGLRTGAIERVIKTFIDRRIKLKLSEQLAEELVGHMVSEAERRRRQARLEYEEKLKKEREEMEYKEKEREKQRLEEERKKKLDEEEAKRKLEEDKRRSLVEDELLMMDLSSAKIRDIKEKMDDLRISHVGATCREDLLQKLRDKVPRLRVKLDQPSSQYQQTDGNLSSYNTSSRRSLFQTDSLTGGGGGRGGGDDATRLKRRVQQLEQNVDELDQRREQLTDERDSLQKRLQEKDEELRKKDKMISDIRKGGGGGGASNSPKIKSLEEELLETRMLYSCTLEDMDIMGVIAKRDEGVVVRVKCTKPGIPNPSRVFAMKIMTNILDTSTLTNVRSNFRNEYDILSGLPPHDNIVKLFAFFYDRPKAYPKLKQCGEGLALCMLMEQLSQNMQEHINSLRRANGPMASRTIRWIQDVICGLQYLFSHHVVHRDMKLENLLMATDGIKIGDFGTAILLDSTMKLPFAHVAPRGGNEAHLAPEVLNVRSGPRKVIDYNKQPVWAAGVLAYELAGHLSPFEGGRIDQRAYDVSSLPPLKSTYCQISSRQQSLPYELGILVKSMLAYEPENRPTLNEVYQKISRL